MVSIDNVYKTVLNILNKENRGYVTPREFNTLALQAQSEIFEGYFSSRNFAITNESDYSDIRKNIEEKISLFENEETISSSSFANAEGDTTNSYYAYPNNFYRLSTVSYSYSGDTCEVEETSNKKILYINKSPLTKPTTKNPMFVRHEGGIVVYPTTGITNVLLSYVRKPSDPKWVGGTTAGQIVAQSSASDYQDFELHASEFHELVIKILAYTGVIVRAGDIAQAAAAKEQQIIQSER